MEFVSIIVGGVPSKVPRRVAEQVGLADGDACDDVGTLDRIIDLNEELIVQTCEAIAAKYEGEA